MEDDLTAGKLDWVANEASQSALLELLSLYPVRGQIAS
jgi:hypothetical protein